MHVLSNQQIIKKEVAMKAVFLLSVLFVTLTSVQASSDENEKDINDNKNLYSAYHYAEFASAAIIMHELGHYIIDNYNIEAFTFEEDLADSFVVYSLLKKPSQYTSFDKYERESEIFHKILISGADIYYYRNLLGLDRATEVSEHSTDKKRFMNYVCLMKDGNTDFFNDYIKKRQLEVALNGKCNSRYKKLVNSWNYYVGNFWRENESKNYEINYTIPSNENHEPLRIYLQARQKSGSGWIDQMLKSFPILFKKRITINFETCNGSINAYYYEKTSTITFCYEYFLSLRELRLKIYELKDSL